MSRNALGVLCVALLAGATAAPAQQLDRALSGEEEIQREAERSQKRVERTSDDTQRMLDEYRATRQQTDTLRVYNEQLQGLIGAQREEIASLGRQIEDVTEIEREILPLMAAMIEALEDFVELDVPFLLDERRRRVTHLRELMARADVTTSEKYRRLIEAYQIENDYGRAVDAYRGTLELGGATMTVDFLKVGRVAFLYLTLDGSEAGAWDTTSRSWTDASDYRGEIRRGLKMANKQAAFDLLTLPLPAPSEPSS
jgi:hypothetical protein